MQKVKCVSPSTLRKRFNQSQYPELIANGSLRAEYLRNRHLQEPQKCGEPPCIHSQMIRYLDADGRWMVEIHQYLRKDQTIGGSGRPDPKRLRSEDTVLILKRGT